MSGWVVMAIGPGALPPGPSEVRALEFSNAKAHNLLTLSIYDFRSV